MWVDIKYPQICRRFMKLTKVHYIMFCRYAGGSLPTLPLDLGNRLLDIVNKLDDYQEPYQALKCAPYSYSTVVMEMKDMMLNNKAASINHPTGRFEIRFHRKVCRLQEGSLL